MSATSQTMHSLSIYEVRIRDAASAFLSIHYALAEKHGTVMGIAHKLSLISTQVGILKVLLVDEPAECEDGLGRIQAYSPAIERIETLKCDIDQWIEAGTPDPSPLTEVRADSEDHLDLTRCLRSLSVIVTNARQKQLINKFGKQTLEDKREVGRLAEAFIHMTSTSPVSPSPPPTKTPIASGSTTSTLPPPSTEPSLPLDSPREKDILELQHPRGFRGRYGHPDYPLQVKASHVTLQPEQPGLIFEKSFEESELNRFDLKLDGKYPSVAHFDIWPPVNIAENSIQDHQLRSVMANGGCPPVTVSAPNNASNNTPNNPSSAAPGSSLGGQCNNPTGQAISSASAVQTSNPFTFAIPNVSMKKPEAWMLVPQAEEICNIVQWSQNIESLPLTKQQIQAHLCKFGPNYSVMEAITTIDPEQWKLIRNHVKNRHGDLLSIEKCQPASLRTKFGSFKMQSVMFIVDTAAPAEPASESHGGFIRQPLFGGESLAPECGQVSRGSAQKHVGAHQDDAGFGTGAAGFTQAALRGSFIACTGTNKVPFTPYAEPDGANNSQHFQTITFQPAYQNHSLEELRAADYAQNRRGFGNMNQSGFGIFGPSNESQNMASDQSRAFDTTCGGTHANDQGDGRFDASHSRAPNVAQSSLSANLGNQQNTPQPSLFSNLDNQRNTQRPSLFANLGDQQNTQQPSLFGTLGNQRNSEQPPRTSLFGASVAQNPAAAPSSGLFANTQPSQTGAGVGLFGNTTRPSLFANSAVPTQSSSLFANPSANQNGNTGGGLFGSSRAGGAVPTTNTSVFGTPGASLFGRGPRMNPGVHSQLVNTGSNNEPFTGTSLFGGTNNQAASRSVVDGFGGSGTAVTTQSTSASPFSNTQPTTSDLFGRSTTSGTVGTSQHSHFGGNTNHLSTQPPEMEAFRQTQHNSAFHTGDSLFARHGAGAQPNNSPSIGLFEQLAESNRPGADHRSTAAGPAPFLKSPTPTGVSLFSGFGRPSDVTEISGTSTRSSGGNNGHSSSSSNANGSSLSISAQLTQSSQENQTSSNEKPDKSNVGTETSGEEQVGVNVKEARDEKATGTDEAGDKKAFVETDDEDGVETQGIKS